MRPTYMLAITAVALLPLTAQAQYAPSWDQTVLYGVKKNQMPQGMVIEQGVANPGIPTSGTQQAQQLKKIHLLPCYGYPGYG